MWIALLILSIACAAYGVYNLTQATLGVGLVGVGAILGILARLAQASKHQAESVEYLRQIEAQARWSRKEQKSAGAD